MVEFSTNRVLVGRMGKLNIDERPTTEVDSPRNVVPEQHGKQARNAEDQRKGEKIPLFSQKIYIGIAKELHGFV